MAIPTRSRPTRLGYREGANLALHLRFAEGQLARIPALAQKLVNLEPDVIVSGTVTTTALRELTSKIPIVMGNSPDPVAAGFVQSLARPGAGVRSPVAKGWLDWMANQ